MAPHRRRNLVASRRRVDDEGEDEEGSLVDDVDDDSLSEGSVITNPEDDADGEGGGTSEDEAPAPEEPIKVNGHTNGLAAESKGSEPVKPTVSAKGAFPVAATDTDAMMNGLRIDDQESTTAIEFDDMTADMDNAATASKAKSLTPPAQDGRQETLGEKRRREHEEYKKKRDTDPAFVPNRGGFFMHDSRSAESGSNGFRPPIRGRVKGRGGFVGTGPVGDVPLAMEVTNGQWAHDLHETVTQPAHQSQKPLVAPSNNVPRPADKFDPPLAAPRSGASNRSFSKSTQTGTVTVRVSFPGMPQPKHIHGISVFQHTRLPQHRPPLRRDKPVRISIASHPARYIFPSTERSFIFIPRALRPNQHGYNRGRGRGPMGGYGSRRTSTYGGSNYTPSVAMSRRSSFGRAASREGFISPTGSVLSRPPMTGMDQTKPVVRLPIVTAPQVAPLPLPNAGSPIVVSAPPVQPYPLPQMPTFRENRPIPLEMHQPRPQKAVSVTNIESPGDSFTFNPPQQQQEQPFHQQVPHQVNGATFGPDAPVYNPHSRHPSHPSQPSGTPLSQIPERAIHAQPFQPYSFSQPQGFYAAAYPPYYYYNPAGAESPNFTGPSATAPPFIPGAQPVPLMVPALPPTGEQTAQAGTFAVESNGMVHYLTSTQVYDGGPPSFPPAGYVIPQTGGVVGMGGMMTPPGTYYYPAQGGVYYPPQ